MSREPVRLEQVAYALRSVRAASYRLEAADGGVVLALIMNASPAGRRNAAGRIVRLIEEHGMEFGVDAAVDALTADRAAVPIHSRR